MIRPFFAALLVLAALPSAAAAAPACNRPGLGTVACQEGRLCECIFDRGGAMTGIPAGFRWDCGILRPRCGDAAVPPASVEEYRGTPPQLPLAIGIDRSQRNVTIGGE